MLKINANKLFVVISLISLGVACRLLPHPWNMSPIAAIALFSGFYFRSSIALLLPIVSLAIGDIFIGTYDWRLMSVVYFSYAIICGAGYIIKKNKNTETVVAGSFFASISFFISTNWAVWQFSSWYAPTVNGLMSCYLMALPFFRNTLLGDLFFTGMIFGCYEMSVYFSKNKEQIKKIIKDDSLIFG